MEQAADKVQAESLDAQVDALLGEMNQACEKLQTQLGDDAPAAGAGATQEAAAALDDLNEQVDELLKGVVAVAPLVSEPAERAPATEVFQAPVVSTGSMQAPAKVAEVEQVFTDELAALTDSLLTEPVAAVPQVAAATTIAVEVVPVNPPAVSVAPQVAAAVVAVAPAATALAPAAAAVEVPAARPKVNIGGIAARVGRAAGSMLVKVGKLGEPHALRVAAMISAPILSKPKHVRDTLGWLAAWSLFVGTCFAVFVFFIRTPPSPVTTDPHVRLADEHASAGHTGEVVRRGVPHAEEPAAAGHGAPAGHGEAAGGDGHGEAKPKTPKKADAKKAPPKKKDAKKKPDAHGEAGAAPAHH